jgi:hypothetical protein
MFRRPRVDVASKLAPTRRLCPIEPYGLPFAGSLRCLCENPDCPRELVEMRFHFGLFVVSQ